MSSIDPRRIVIVGGGFAGAVTAIKLIDAIEGPLAIDIVEPSPELGRGIAFGVRDRDFFVNGLAKAFGLHPDDTDHLPRWLAANQGRWSWRPLGGAPWSESAPPRAIFGDYVADELEAACRRGEGRATLAHHRDRAVAVHEGPRSASVRLASGATLLADEVVLATGLYKKTLDVEGERDGSAYVADPWQPGAFDGAGEARRVLLLGTSLTMLDSIIALEKAGFRGGYEALSSRGLVLHARRDAPAWRDFLGAAPLPRTALALLRSVQRERRAIEAAGEDWQRIVLAVRPHLPALWNTTELAERRRFIRHLRSYWDVTLHRAPPASFAVLERLRQEGRFQSIAGKVKRLQADGGGVAATYRRRGAAQETTDRYDLVVNALGHEFDWRRVDDPLPRQLLRDGFVRPHATGFGIDADRASKAVIGHRGIASDRLFAVGHPLRGVSWESNSIPEQVAGATELANSLAGIERRAKAVA